MTVLWDLNLVSKRVRLHNLCQENIPKKDYLLIWLLE